MDLLHILFDDRYRSKILFSSTHAHAYDLKVKVIDLQILIVNSLKAHIFQTIRWIWFIFGMMIDTGSEFYSMILWPMPMTKGQGHRLILKKFGVLDSYFINRYIIIKYRSSLI